MDFWKAFYTFDHAISLENLIMLASDVKFTIDLNTDRIIVRSL